MYKSTLNPDDMHKFSKIENLIEQEVFKAPVPEEFGDAPEYKPSERRGGGGKKFYRKKKR